MKIFWFWVKIVKYGFVFFLRGDGYVFRKLDWRFSVGCFLVLDLLVGIIICVDKKGGLYELFVVYVCIWW